MRGGVEVEGEVEGEVEVEVEVEGEVEAEGGDKFLLVQFFDFTEMPVWQKANFVVETVYALCLKLPKSEDYALSSQLKRAALSITANIAEGFGRNHSKDKINFYYYARGSVFEVRSHLIVGKNLQFFTPDDINLLQDICKEIIEGLNKIIKGLSGNS